MFGFINSTHMTSFKKKPKMSSKPILLKTINNKNNYLLLYIFICLTLIGILLAVLIISKNSTIINNLKSENSSKLNVKVGDYIEGGIVFFSKNGHIRIVTKNDLNFTGVVGKDWKKANEFCQNQNISGHKNWYLPDADELNLIRNELFGKFNSHISHNYYLSSTLNDRKEPMVVNLGGGLYSESGGHINEVRFKVRAVRKIGY
jgi:hypothetical protein